jgi:hypothetical protein
MPGNDCASLLTGHGDGCECRIGCVRLVVELALVRDRSFESFVRQASHNTTLTYSAVAQLHILWMVHRFLSSQLIPHYY